MIPDANAMTRTVVPHTAVLDHACDEATEPVIDASARPLLTARVLTALKRLLPVMNQVAGRDGVQILRTDITGYVDPEDGSRELVITQLVGLEADAALRYWDRLGSAVQQWSSSLSATQAEILAARIAIAVRWEQDDTIAAGI